ncbi:benzoylformate decarboxylase [Streptomyces sp. SP17BM10]|uniref:benzoylformate decarboxylase n=1 Tax=Streptomyces sp. SP17BM10 TaxID=3002530 RepID=UPI002E776E19|nr:benzoylformate decarboxylase [Streptomyces sp. SP17BM10]MEE1784456.1 benzoylformate decarboxylase [Streptomyces sp. SP17BM10]
MPARQDEPTGRPPTVREATFALLRSLGMTTVFGNPGSTELPMFREFPADFRYVLGLQESVVLAMADGFAQAGRRPAVVNLHSAAGVGHAMGSLFTAWRNRTPLVIVAGQQARSLLGGEPYLLNDQAAELPKPYVKWSREPARAEDVPAAIARACYLAMSPPHGPTLVSVPADDWDRPCGPVEPRTVSTTLRADPEALERVGRALAGAARPAFVVGAAVDQDGAFAEVVELAERHRAAVWAAPMSSRCAFPETHPLFAGFLPPVREEIVARLTGHDVVLSLGAPVFTYHVAGGGPVLPPGTALHQLTDDPATAAWTPVGDALLTGIRLGVRDLLAFDPAVPRELPPPRPAPAPVPDTDVITQPLLMRTLADLRPTRSVIVEEAPSSRPVMCEYLPNERPESFYTCASGSLGHSLPAAVGMALGRPGERVIAVVGDGSAMYSIQALWSAAELGLPLTVLVVNNGRYATVDRFADRFGLGKAVGTAIGGLDFAALARAQGCAAGRVEHPARLARALRTALASPRPYLLDVRVGD